MPKQNLDFILGGNAEPSSKGFIFYKQEGKIIAQKFYLNNSMLKNPVFEEGGLALTLYGKFELPETYNNLETLKKICKSRNYELIRVNSKNQIYNAFKNRARNFLEYLLRHYVENFKDVKIQLSTNWEDLKRKKH